jgi:hypothetical protein
VTIALLPRRANAIGRFARLSSAVREAATHRALLQPTETPAINEGRWATMPGEYSGPRTRPLDRTLPAITASGISAPISCAGFGPVTVHLAGTWVGRVAFEGSVDGVTWSRLALTALDGGSDGTETDRPGLWRTLPHQPISFIRFRVTRLAGGTMLAAVASAPAMHHLADEALDSAA